MPKVTSCIPEGVSFVKGGVPVLNRRGCVFVTVCVYHEE